MAGGSGSRFWPLSHFNNPKQFIDVLGTGESMLQSTFRRFEQVCPRSNIIIVTAQGSVDMVRRQIPGLADYQVLGEPLRRNTAPCIAYAAAVIYAMNPEAIVIVSPSDHAIFGLDHFLHNMATAVDIVAHNDWIVTIGVQPTNPNVKYGYIQFDDRPSLPLSPLLHKVRTFTEKPPIDMAMQFINSGEFYWNAGIFVWRLPVLMENFRLYLPEVADAFFSLSLSTPQQVLADVYSHCEPVSVDVAIMEKASQIYMLEATFGWSDVETWESLYATAPKDDDGNVFIGGKVFAYDVSNCLVNLPKDRIAVLHGLDGYVVTEGNGTILVSPRSDEEHFVKFSSDVELWLNSCQNKK